MTQTSTKKKKERMALDAFLSKMVLEVGDLEERERPDFIVGIGNRRIGVEVRETVREGLAHLASESERRVPHIERTLIEHGVFVDLVVAPFEARAGLFGLPGRERTEAVRDLISRVTEVAAELETSRSGTTHADLERPDNREGGPSRLVKRPIPGISWIRVALRNDRTTNVYVIPSSTRWGGPLPVLRQLVAKKEPKINDYRSSSDVDDVWLLLHVDGSFASEFEEYEIAGLSLESRFDAVGIVGVARPDGKQWASWLKAPEPHP